MLKSSQVHGQLLRSQMPRFRHAQNAAWLAAWSIEECCVLAHGASAALSKNTRNPAVPDPNRRR